MHIAWPRNKEIQSFEFELESSNEYHWMICDKKKEYTIIVALLQIPELGL